MIARILLGVSGVQLQRKIARALEGQDVIVETVDNRNRLWEGVGRENVDFIFVEHAMLPQAGWRETLANLKDLPESPEVLVIVDHEDPALRADLLAVGCTAVVNHKLPLETVSEVLVALIARRAESVERAVSARTIDEPRLSDFVSLSPAMSAFMNVVERVAPSNSSLLILGETGVGKERLARAIHAASPRMFGPFIAVNCGALPESLLESELFGHEKGAFTGATRSRRGCFELSHGGTIFLDEIGEMAPHLQVRLLRVIQERCVQRVGAERSVSIDVRIMAATNRNLSESVESGTFRRDLFYRLGVVTLTLPPLRDRREDIPELARSYVEYLRPRIGVEVKGISERAVEALVHYDWPGNVRELVNVIERAMLLCHEENVGIADLPEVISGTKGRSEPLPLPLEQAGPDWSIAMPAGWTEMSWRDVRESVLQAAERLYISRALEQSGGRVGSAARAAGMEPRSFYEKMRRHNIKKETFRN